MVGALPAVSALRDVSPGLGKAVRCVVLKDDQPQNEQRKSASSSSQPDQVSEPDFWRFACMVGAMLLVMLVIASWLGEL
jgi:hypothetical protein